MSLPYFNLYPTDFEAKTSHLTMEEDGAYNRLLRLCWMSPGCSLPDDDAWIMRRMRVDTDTFERVVRVILDEFFERKNGRLAATVFEEWEILRRRDNYRQPIPKSVLDEVKDEGACAYCGSESGPFEVDHIIPWSRGGSNERGNLTLACAPCNRSKSNKTPEEWTQ